VSKFLNQRISLGFISWSYIKKFKVFGLLNYANIFKSKKVIVMFFSHYLKKVYGWLNYEKKTKPSDLIGGI